MSRKLAVNVTIDGTTYVAGSVPSADVARAISNPKAWGAEPEPDAATPPAKSGPNAGAARWAAYAESVGVDVPDGAKQGEIVALLEAAGKPTE